MLDLAYEYYPIAMLILGIIIGFSFSWLLWEIQEATTDKVE